MDYKLCETCDATQDECNLYRPPYPYCFKEEVLCQKEDDDDHPSI